MLKKDLNNLNQIKKSNIDFSIREMTKKDFDAIFTDEIIHSNANEYKNYSEKGRYYMIMVLMNVMFQLIRVTPLFLFNGL